MLLSIHDFPKYICSTSINLGTYEENTKSPGIFYDDLPFVSLLLKEIEAFSTQADSKISATVNRPGEIIIEKKKEKDNIFIRSQSAHGRPFCIAPAAPHELK